jgi:signal transduction histidine kinase/CheY-like chemotaxis protein
MTTRVEASTATADPPNQPDSGSPSQRLEHLRDRLLNGTLIALALLGLPAYPAGMAETIQLDQWLMALAYSALYLPLPVIALLRRRLGYRVRAWALLGLTYSFGLAILLEFGLSGTGPLILLTMCVYATSLIGIRTGLLASAVSVATMAIVGTAMCTGLLPFRQELAANSVTPVSWLVTGALFLMLAMTLVLGSGRVLEHLQRSLAKEHERSQELALANENLTAEAEERRRAEAEKDSLQQQLLHAQKMEAIGSLAGGLAHDFNNLLTIIRLNTELLLRSVPGCPEAIDIRDATKRAETLTRQLLAFSRRQLIHPHPVDLNALLWDLEKMLRRLLGEDIQLDLSGCQAQGGIQADPGQIEQVIVNLAVNARDAMPQGGRLEFSTEDDRIDAQEADRLGEIAAGPVLVLRVRDTGTGMDPTTSARVFEPFFTTKPPERGSGLGLSTVFGIVQQHGGAIELRSAPGAGTEFVLRFPRIEFDLAKSAVDTAAVEAIGGSESILLVEDEPHLLRASQRILTSLGYRLIPAQDGLEALRLMDRTDQAPDLLMSDVVMPGMSGRVLSETLKVRWPDLRVLFTSGHTDDTVLRSGVARGTVAFLAKPYSPQSLAAAVRAALDAPAPKAPAPSNPQPG